MAQNDSPKHVPPPLGLGPAPTISVSHSTSSVSTHSSITSPAIHPAPSLASLSRNASVISSSSSSSSVNSVVLPLRPRPIRTFSNTPPTNNNSRAKSPASPTTPRSPRPPGYALKTFGLDDESERQAGGDHFRRTAPNYSTARRGPSVERERNSTLLPPMPIPNGASINGTDDQQSTPIANTLSVSPPTVITRTRARSNSAQKRVYTPADFDFGEVLGEGSYSTVRVRARNLPRITH